MRLNTLVSVPYLLIPIRLHLIKNDATAYYLKVRVKFRVWVRVSVRVGVRVRVSAEGWTLAILRGFTLAFRVRDRDRVTILGLGFGLLFGLGLGVRPA